MSDGKSKTGLWVGVLVIVVAAAGAAAYYLLPSKTAAPAASAQTAAVPKPADASPAAPAATAPAAPVAPRTDLSISELLSLAAKALNEGRLIEPAGNNAAEYYQLVLQKDPGNNAATDGLREMFPMATGAIEQKINAGQVEESMAAISLLGKSDPNNYTLTILRNKLDLKKKQIDRDQEKKDQERQVAVNAARNANTPPPAVLPPPAPVASAPSAAPVAAPPVAAPASAPASAPVSTTAAAAPAVAAAPVAAATETRGAALIKRVNPTYPPEAARRREEGWVEVGFTVGVDGKVKDASVLSANPARIFNDAALRAVVNWTFQPRLENGRPVEQQVKSRIEFKL